MFDLDVESPPTAAAALADALEDSVRRRLAFDDERPRVQVRAESWPACDELRLDITGGHVSVVDEADARPPRITGDRAAGPLFETVEMLGQPLHAGPAAVRMTFRASHMAFDYGRSADGRWVMEPSAGAAGSGTLEASITRAGLADLLREMAVAQGGRLGVTFERLDADVHLPGPREMAVEARLKGRKRLGFLNPSFSCSLRMRGDVDEELVGRVRELDLRGEGAVTSAALAVLRPRIEAWRSRPWDLRERLAGLFPAGRAVRDVRLSEEGDRLVLRAWFGDAGEGSDG